MICLFTSLALSGCAEVSALLATPASGTALATAVPEAELPTVLAQTLEASNQDAQLEATTATNTPVLASPPPGTTRPPSPTAPPLIPTNSVYPEAVIKILRPGPYSKVTSPFEFVANLPPGADGNVTIELIGEDGELLVRKIVDHFTLPGYASGNLVDELEFEILGVAESARLALSIVDEYGRTSALSSVNLVLLSDGLTENNPYTDLQENIVIQNPGGSVMVTGERLLVSGLARTQSDKPLMVEIIDREGKVLGWTQAAVVKDEGEAYGVFVAEVAFSVDEPTWVRVVVSEHGKGIGGTVHVASVEIVIGP